jgi:hypothetical protein
MFRSVRLTLARKTIMDSATKAAHKFNIWKLAISGAEPERKPVEYSRPAPPDGNASPRAAPDRPRHSAVRMARPTVRPFAAKCTLPNGAKCGCETKRVEPERIDVTFKQAAEPKVEVPVNIKVGLDLDYFGFVRGIVSDSHEAGFSIAPDIIYHEMLVAKLAELHALGPGLENERSILDRLAARITLRKPDCIYRVVESDAVIYHAKIALLSYKVATLRTAQIQRAGTRVLLGWPNAHPGIVARSFESGFTIEFDAMLEDLHEDLHFG